MVTQKKKKKKLPLKEGIDLSVCVWNEYRKTLCS